MIMVIVFIVVALVPKDRTVYCDSRFVACKVYKGVSSYLSKGDFYSVKGLCSRCQSKLC